MQHAPLVVVQAETALQVRVPEEGDLRRRVQQTVDGLGGSENVFVFVAKSTVHDYESVHGEGTGGQLLKPFAIFAAQLIAGPKGDGPRDGIEVIGIGQT